MGIGLSTFPLEYEKLNNRTNPVLLNKTLGWVAYNLAKYLRIYSNNIELKSES